MGKGTFLKSSVVRMILLIVCIVLPINIITVALTQVILSNSHKQVAEEIQKSLDITAQDLSEDLKWATRKLTYQCLLNSDFIALAGDLDRYSNTQQSRMKHEVIDQVEEMVSDYPIADLIFYSYPQHDLFISNGSPGIARDTYQTELMKMVANDLDYGVKWKMTTLDDVAVLVGYSGWYSIDFGILLNLERTLDDIEKNRDAQGRCLFFMDDEQLVYTKKGSEFLKATGHTMKTLQDSKDYNVYISSMGDGEIQLVEVVEKAGFTAFLDDTMKILGVVVLLLTVLSVPLLLYCTKKWISNPLSNLTRAMDIIEQGNLNYRIETKTVGSEFKRINKNFNQMMDQIEGLKIDAYEEQLEKKNIRMRYLSQQVQPHFILNAMNILYSYEPEEYALSRKMILCISKYFRYVVKVNAAFVVLSQEMDHIKNYFEIQQARFPGLFFSIVEYEEGLKRALIPPLLIQNFAENAIKHSLKIGNKVTIYVIAEYFKEDDAKPKMRIRLADTGEGITDDVLNKIKTFQETGVWQDGLGVGIQNAIERLKYLYDGEETQIRIWRDERYPGTNVEMILPIHYEGEGVPTFEDFNS